MPELTVTPLGKEELPFAWPLVRSGGYELGLTGWLLDGQSLIARGGVVIGALAPDSTMFGIAACEPVQQRRLRVLHVATFVAFELSRRAPVRRALTDRIEMLCEELDCAAIAVPGVDGPLLKELRKRRALSPSDCTDARAAAAAPFR